MVSYTEMMAVVRNAMENSTIIEDQNVQALKPLALKELRAKLATDEEEVSVIIGAQVALYLATDKDWQSYWDENQDLLVAGDLVALINRLDQVVGAIVEVLDEGAVIVDALGQPVAVN